VRGICEPYGIKRIFFKGENCSQSCRTQSLGACCSKATASSTATCTTRTYRECTINQHKPDTTYLGFAWNKTCAEVDCGQYGACCSADTAYKGDYTKPRILGVVMLDVLQGPITMSW
jgi:hypothetical protein